MGHILIQAGTHMNASSTKSGTSAVSYAYTAVGAVGAVLALGFNWFGFGFGWTLPVTADRMASQRVETALVEAYTPVCVDRFVKQADAAKWKEFGDITSSERQEYISKTGFATMLGAKETNSGVAFACSASLSQLLEKRMPK